MSDKTDTPDTPAPLAPSEPPSKPPRRRRWRRRLLIALGAVLVLVVLLRIFLHLLLPPIISQVARQFGFDITYRRLDLVMLGGDFAIWDVVLKPLDGRNELIRTDYAFVNLDTLEALKLRIHVLRLEADTVKVDLVRKADGTIPLLEQLARGAAVSTPDEKPSPTPSTSPTDALPKLAIAPKPIPPSTEVRPTEDKPLNFTIPITVDAVRLNRVVLDVLDESVTPNFKQNINVNLSVSRLGTQGTPAQLDLSVWTTSFLDRLKLSGWFEVHGVNATGALTLDVRGLRPEHAAGYLSLVGLRADGRAMDIHGGADIRLQANITRPGTVSGSASLSNMYVTAGGSSAASLKLVSIDIGELSPSNLWLRRIDVRDGAIETRRGEDGSLGFASIHTVAAMPGATPGQTSTSPANAPTVAPVLASASPTASLARTDQKTVASAPVTKPPVAAPPVDATPVDATPAFILRIDEVTASGLAATFSDSAIAPPTTLVAELTDLHLGNVVSIGPADTQTTVRARLRLPGVTEDVRVEGTIKPFASDPTGNLAVSASGIRPERLAPYLTTVHARSTLDAGEFSCSIIASANLGQPDPVLSLAIKDVLLTDLGKPVLEMPEIALSGLSFEDGIALDSATLRGPSLTLRTLPEGRLQLPGLIYDPTLVAASPSQHATQVAEAAAPAPITPDTQFVEAAPTPITTGPRLPKLRLGRVAWEAGTLRFEDGRTDNAEPIVLDDARFELNDLAFDPRNGNPVSTKPGRIVGRLKVADVIESLTIDGTITPAPRTLEVAVQVNGDALRLAKLAPYLAPLGIEPTWNDARVTLSADAKLQQLDDGVQFAGNLRALKVADDSTVFIEAAHLGVDRLTMRNGAIELGNVTIDRPVLRAERDEQARLIVAGIKLVPPPAPSAAPSPAPLPRLAASPLPAATPAPADASTPAPAPAAPVADNNASAPVIELFTTLQKIGVVSMQALNASGVTLVWSDHALPRPVDLRASIDATLTAFSLNRPNPAPATFRVEIAGEQAVGSLGLEGTLLVAPTSIELATIVSARRITADAISPYLPSGISESLTNGTLQLAVKAQLGRHPQGGYAGSLDLADLAYRDGDRTLASLDRFEFALARFDPSADVIAIDKVTLAGLQADLVRAEDGAIDAFGVRLDAADHAPTQPAPAADASAPLPEKALAAAPVAATLPPAAPGQPADASEPTRLADAVAITPAADADALPRSADAVAPSSDVPDVDLQSLVAQARATLPLISLETIDLNLRRISFTDRMRPQAAPVALADLRLHNTAPLRLFGKTPRDNPPVAFAIDGSIDPLIGKFGIKSSVAAFADRPMLSVSVSASGIDGAALNRIAPELDGLLDGSTLVDGHFHTRLNAEARFKRSIDFSRGFDLDFTIDDTRFTLGQDGIVLAGVKAVGARQVKVDPQSGNILARAVEIDGLEANLWLDEKGLNVLGVALPMPADTPSTRPANDPPGVSGIDEASAPPDPAAPATPTAPAADSSDSASVADTVNAPKPEIRIDSLTISGLQFRLENRTVDPPTVIPVTALDADIRGLSTLATTAERPVRFDLSMAAGKVKLPKPVRGGIITGALADVQAQSRGQQVGGRELEERDFFAQIAARGEMMLYPKPKGRAVASVSGMELAALRGLAERAGIAISEGTFDGRFDLKSRENGDLDAKVKLVLTDLQLADSPDGAVQRYLSLPAPIDTVIGVVQSADGSITLPLGFAVRDGAVNVGEIVASGVGALSQVLVTAVASAPVKMVTGVASLIGEVKGEMMTVEDEPLLLALDPGVVELPTEARQKLSAILAEAARNKNIAVEIQHQLGTDDVALSSQRANPERAQVIALAEQLRARRTELLAQRDATLRLARTQASGVWHQSGADAVQQLRAIQSELAATERSFDALYDMLRPGAERDAARRARAAALSVADARLQRVRSMVESIAGSVGAERVRLGVARYNPGDAQKSQLLVKVARRVQVR